MSETKVLKCRGDDNHYTILCIIDYTVHVGESLQNLRKVCPRMPWHDVMCSVTGPALLDVVAHFIQRYNFNKVNLYIFFTKILT